MAATASVTPPYPTDDDRDDLGIAVERKVKHSHTIGVWEPQVDHDRIKGEGAQMHQRGRGVGCLSNREPVGLEGLRNQFSEIRVIFNDKDSRF